MSTEKFDDDLDITFIDDGKPVDDDSQQDFKFDFEPENMSNAKLAVIGVGGAGGNAVGSMVESNVDNVIHMICNTDLQALRRSPVQKQIQIGEKLTRGLGAGGNPNIGKEAAKESLMRIEEEIEDVDLLFVTAGMGGGTGTGAASVIANMAKEKNILTVGVVTKPFSFEGPNRARLANQGLELLKDSVNTLIVIPNQRLLDLDEANLSFMQAFKKADEVLANAVRGISDLITTAGYVNVDFADVRAIMENSGMAIMGTGYGTGENRAVDAARSAISSPLLDNLDIAGAQGVLINITGSSELTLVEADEAISFIQEGVDPNANFIFGYVTDESLEDRVKVTVIATGFPYANGQERIREDLKIKRKHFQENFQTNLNIPAWTRNAGSARTERTSTHTPPAAPNEVNSAMLGEFNRGFAPDIVEPTVSERQYQVPSYRRREVSRDRGEK